MEIDTCVEARPVVQMQCIAETESTEADKSSTKLGAYATVVAHAHTTHEWANT